MAKIAEHMSITLLVPECVHIGDLVEEITAGLIVLIIELNQGVGEVHQSKVVVYLRVVIHREWRM